MIRRLCSSSDDISIFPPSNHENLQIPVENYSLPKQSPLSTSSSSSFSSPRSCSSSPSDDSSSSSEDLPPAAPCPVVTKVPTDKISGWLGLGFGILRAKIANAATSFGGGGVKIALTGAFVVWYFSAWLRRRRELRLERDRIHHLTSVVKERDARIGELLNQIARLNEVLVARHRAG